MGSSNDLPVASGVGFWTWLQAGRGTRYISTNNILRSMRPVRLTHLTLER